MSKQLKTITYIFLGFHCIPFFYLLFRKDYVSNFYRGDIGGFSSILYALVFFTSVSLFSRVKVKYIRLRLLDFLFSKRIISILSIVFLILSVQFFNNYGLSFRQSGEGLKSGGAILFLHLILKNYFKVILFLNLVYLLNFNKHYNTKTIIFIVFSSFALSITGSLDLLLILFSLLILINSKLLISKMSKNHVLVLTLMIISLVFVGIGNKIGVSNTYLIFTNKENLLFLSDHFLKRIAVWHQAIPVMSEEFIFSYDKSLEIISNIFENSISRFKILMGYNYERPEIWSMNRYNFLLLFQDNSNPITGSSPGIVASSQVLFPIFFIPLSFALGQLIKSITSLIKPEINIVLNIFLIFIFIFPLFASPIDLINIFNPDFVFLFLFLTSLSYLNNKLNGFNKG